MKIESLKEYIRQEIKKAIKEELKEYIFESFVQKKENVSPFEKIKNVETNNSNQPSVETQKPKKFIKYTNNDVLNKVLNETSGGVPKDGNYVGLMGEDFETKSESLNEMKVPESAPEPVKTVVNAINRDYRSLLKAVEKKKSNN